MRYLLVCLTCLAFIFSANASFAGLYSAKRQARMDIQGTQANIEKLPIRLSDLDDKVKCHKAQPSPYPQKSAGGSPSHRAINRKDETCVE